MAISDWTKTGAGLWTRDTSVKYAGVSSGKLRHPASGNGSGSTYITRAATGDEIKVLVWTKYTGVQTNAKLDVGYSNYGDYTLSSGPDSWDWTKLRLIFYNYGGHMYLWISKLVDGEWQDWGSEPHDLGAGTGVAGNLKFLVQGSASGYGLLNIDDVYVYKKP